MKPGFAVAHPGRRLPNLGGPLRHPLGGFLQPLLLRAVLAVFEGGALPLPQALGHEFVVSAGKVGHRPILEVPDPGADPAQQRPVVGNQQDRPFEAVQAAAQQGLPLPVQVRGRLVGEQQPGPGGEGAGDPVPGHFPAGQALPVFLRAEHGPGFPIPAGVRVALLVDHGDGAEPAHRALVRHEFPGQNPQQRGFSGAVFADQADSFVFAYRQPARVQQQAVSEGITEAFGLQNGFGHEKNLLPGRWRKHEQDRQKKRRPVSAFATSRRQHKKSFRIRRTRILCRRISVANSHQSAKPVLSSIWKKAYPRSSVLSTAF